MSKPGLAVTPPAFLPQVHASSWFSVLDLPGRTVLKVGDDIGVFALTAKAVLAQLDGAERIDLLVNSRGGDSTVARDLHHALKGRVQTATVTGSWMSAAVTLALCAVRIEIEANTQVMLHVPRAACYGPSEELRKAADGLDESAETLRGILLERVKDSALVDSWLDGQDHYLTAAEAVACGLADAVFTLSDEAPAVDVQPRAGSQALPSGPTEDEQVALEMLQAFGSLRVRNRALFMRNVAAWLTYNTTEENDLG